jgi:hypothetical protein
MHSIFPTRTIVPTEDKTKISAHTNPSIANKFEHNTSMEKILI